MNGSPDATWSLRRRIIAPPDRRHESWDDWGGLDPQGDWPEQG